MNKRKLIKLKFPKSKVKIDKKDFKKDLYPKGTWAGD